MNNELTIDECGKAITIYENKLGYIEYLLKAVKDNKKELENANYIFEIDLKSLKFMQKQGFKLDIDFDKYNNDVQECIRRNNHAIKTEININIEKRNVDIESIKTKIMELSQIRGFLIGAITVYKPIIDEVKHKLYVIDEVKYE